MSEHHSESPSHYNAWRECPCWEGSESESAEANAGTIAHEEFAARIADPEFEPESRAAKWAADQVLSLANGAKVETEVKLVGKIEPSLSGIFGTTDATWVDADGVRHYADFKTFSDGMINYRPQLRGYAALNSDSLSSTKKVVLHILHGMKGVVETWEDNEGNCASETVSLLVEVRSGLCKPRLCKWCQYCKKIGGCMETTNAVQVVNENGVRFNNLSMCQKLVVLDAVDKLSKTIREEAKKMAVESGGAIEMDGIRYEMKPWAGKPKVRDLCEVAAEVEKPKYLKVNERKQTAVEIEWTGLTHEELLKLCDIGKSALADAIIAKNPDAVKADVKRYVEQFFEATEGTPHFVRTK